MNKFIYNSLLILFIIIIAYNAFSKQYYHESFLAIPKNLKASYRPFERKIRMSYEGFYTKTSRHFDNFFRKIGIL